MTTSTAIIRAVKKSVLLLYGASFSELYPENIADIYNIAKCIYYFFAGWEHFDDLGEQPDKEQVGHLFDDGKRIGKPPVQKASQTRSI